MILKSLQMFGFKSFANKTVIDFEPGYTALVGPNGCGKSNVVDAIRWVLGEKSAKSIRGEKMEDVIFSGTDQTRPVSFAEVILQFENSNGLLPISGKNIAVTRRLFRDGESEYLINGKSVRLKEIEALFFDTGVGKNAYSVMEQGKIDLIISTKPEERRYIFEEAAGISRYKQQKKDALKKLEDTENNINRIQDILREIEREKEQKKNQSQKAESFKKFKSELTDYEIRHYVLKGNNFREKFASLNGELGALSQRKEELVSKVSSVNVIIEEIKFKKNEIQLHLFEQEKNLISIQHALKNMEEVFARNKSQTAEANERLKSTQEKIVKREANVARINQQLNLLNEQEAKILDQLNVHEKVLSDKLEEKTKKTTEIKEAENSIISNRALLRNIENEEINLQEKLKEVIGKLVVALEKRKKELEVDEQERSSIRQEIYDRLTRYEKYLQEASQLLHHEWSEVHRESLSGMLYQIDISGLKETIRKFESFEDGFRSIFFDKEGIHSQKESIQLDIINLRKNREDIGQENLRFEQFIVETRNELERINHELSEINISLTKNRNELSWLEKQKSMLLEQLHDITAQLEINHKEISGIENRIQSWSMETRKYESEFAQSAEKEKEIINGIEAFREKRKALIEEEQKNESQISRESRELEVLNPEIINLEKSILEVKVKEEQLRESLYQDYELHFDEAQEKIGTENEDISLINKRIAELKSSISSLGIINHLALAEYEELKERFEFYTNQFQDLDKARADIFKLIKDIDSVSAKLFIEAFEKIRKSFSEIFKRLFEGGSADIKLVEDNPLEAGIDIIVQPPGKNPKHLSLLSGGEKTLIAISLLFATYNLRPSPFCFLDEIDAALDESNIDRFINLMSHFAQKSQFIVITHNKRTMSMAKTIYGVTMEQPGISKLISMILEKKEEKREGEIIIN